MRIHGSSQKNMPVAEYEAKFFELSRFATLWFILSVYYFMVHNEAVKSQRFERVRGL